AVPALSADAVALYAYLSPSPALHPSLHSFPTRRSSDLIGLHGVVNKYLPASLNGYQIFTNGGSLCAWYFRDAADYVWDGTSCTLATPGFNDGQWHHVAFVVDASGGTFYVDGVPKAARAWTGTAGPATTTASLTF